MSKETIEKFIESAATKFQKEFTKSTRNTLNKKRQTITLNVKNLQDFIRNQTLATIKNKKGKEQYKYLNGTLSSEELESFTAQLEEILDSFSLGIEVILERIKSLANSRFGTPNQVYTFNSKAQSNTGVYYYTIDVDTPTELVISLELLYIDGERKSESFNAIKDLYREEIANLWKQAANLISSIKFIRNTKSGSQTEVFAIRRRKLQNFLSSKGKAQLGHEKGSSVSEVAVERILRTLVSQIQGHLNSKNLGKYTSNKLLQDLKLEMYAKYISNPKRNTTKLIIDSANKNTKAGATWEKAKYNQVKNSILGQNFLQQLISLGGSDDKITIEKKSIVKTFINTTKKNKRVKKKSINTKPIFSNFTTTPVVKTIKPKQVKDSTKSKSVKVQSAKLPEPSSRQKESVLNLNALKAQINAKLSMTVIKNMGTPALNNQTGRFARSAIVTDVTQTSKGFPSIEYTYQKYPYQTFEPGFKQGSVQRDPRTLIDRSIREIATGIIKARFYTRRA